MPTIRDLKQDLKGWQIFFIVSSVIIGEGIFSGDGKALRTAGPGGALLALFITSIITISMMECCSEFVQLFPCPNAIVKYIEAFVDPDLAWVCGVAYWYTWASVFGALNLTAATFTEYWDFDTTWTVIGFYFLAPFVILGINLCGVGLFGWIETVGGILKIALVFGTGIFLFVLRARDEGSSPLYDGFKADTDVVSNPAAAVCWCIPVFAFSVLGHEAVTVTAFEARSSRSLRLPSQTIAYFIFVLYFFAAIGQFCMVSWQHPSLSSNLQIRINSPLRNESSRTNIMAILASQGMKTMPGFLNGCYIFTVLSASNSALYIASRTLYGLTRELDRMKLPAQIFGKFSAVVYRTGVPATALFGSFLAFFWVPFMHLKKSESGYDHSEVLLEVLTVTSSISCLLVWACLCLAFIRYQRWLKLCHVHLQRPEYEHYNRDSPKYKAFTAFAFAQPIPAYIGMIGSLLVVFVFSTASRWKSDASPRSTLIAYAAPLAFALLWIILKAVKRRRWVKVSDDFVPLYDRLRALQWLKRADYERHTLQGAQREVEEENGARPEL